MKLITPISLIKLLPLYLFPIVVFVYPMINNNNITNANNNYIESIASIEQVETISDLGKPVHMKIERLNLSLDIEDGEYNQTTDSWNISDVNAHYATNTSNILTTESNTVLYGHNTNNVFKATNDLLDGDILKIKTSEGYLVEYYFQAVENVDPLDTNIFSTFSKGRLTLLSCGGFDDSYRRLMEFKLLTVQEIN